MTIQNILKRVAGGEVSVRERVEYYLQNIRQNEHLNAFTSVLEEEALSKADALDEAFKKGEKTGKMAGVVIGVKDLLNQKDTVTTCGSSMLANYRSVYDATVIRKLREEDAIFIGKTNMDEFAMGSSNENSAFGVVKNPLDPEYVPGGSSGGSAAAVAADLCDIALGTDTGGSIRQPAAFTGVVGLKPTYGRVSRYGLVAFASSLDQIGPLSKSVDDAASLLNIISGRDEKDSTSLDAEVPDYTAFLKRDIKGMRFGLPEEYMGEGLDPRIREEVEKALDVIRGLGGIIEKISLPRAAYAIASYYIIAPAEASSNLARYDGVRYGYRNPEARDLIEMYKKTRREGFGDEVKRRIMLGTYVLSAGYYDAYYEKAQKVRRLIREDFDKAFEKADVIIGPTVPNLPFRIGELVDDPLKMYLSDIFTVPTNMAGLCGISIPIGKVGKFPVGLQMTANVLREDLLIQAADAVEENFQEKQDNE